MRCSSSLRDHRAGGSFTSLAATSAVTPPRSWRGSYSTTSPTDYLGPGTPGIREITSRTVRLARLRDVIHLGAKAGVDAVEVDGDVYGAADRGTLACGPGSHVDDLDVVASSLLELRCRSCSGDRRLAPGAYASDPSMIRAVATGVRRTDRLSKSICTRSGRASTCRIVSGVGMMFAPRRAGLQM